MPEQRVLFEYNERVRVGSRALTILTLLVERAGELVSTSDIVRCAWPDTVVEENNLRVHIASLRKILHDDGDRARTILNEPGRGYRFVASVNQGLDGGSREPSPPPQKVPDPPAALVKLVGREYALAALVSFFSRTRLLTLVGPGGIGKTTLAKQGALELAAKYRDGVCFVDLSPLTDPGLVPGAVATALQYVLAPRAAVSALLEHLRERDILLVLDNCEHVIDAVADLVETLLPGCPHVAVLATSRESLRVHGEYVQQLRPLDTPEEKRDITAAEAMTYGSIQLFVERAAAACNGFELTDANAGAVSQVCRNLDGLPLALELGASCAVKLGLDVLLLGLEDRLALLTHGRRTNERHQTLRAMLDWSYAILTETERCLLARLSVFAGWFSLDAAIAIGTDHVVGRPTVIEALSGLAGKSLVTLDTSSQIAQYRLLESTRAYAAEKLSASENREQVQQKHAQYVYDGLGDAEAQWRLLPRAEWWTRFGPQLNDIRAALGWALSAPGQLQFGLRLLAASAPLWLGLSKLEEFHRLLDNVLSRFPVEGPPIFPEEYKLNLLQGVLFMNVDGPSTRRAKVLNRAVELAGFSGDRQSQLTALWAYCGFCFAISEHGTMYESAQRIGEIASAGAEQETRALADRMWALSHYARGELELAQLFGEKSVGIGAAASPSFSTVFRYDQTTTSRANLSLVLFLRGDSDRAGAMLAEAVADSMRARNPNTLVYILSHIACPLALWLDDRDVASQYTELLHDTSNENGWTYMLEVSNWWNFVLSQNGTAHHYPSPQRFDGLYPLQRDLLIASCPGLVDEEALSRANRKPHHWASAEIVRAHGERLLALGGRSAYGEADRAFRLAIEISLTQGAVAWHRRAKRSLASLQYQYGALESL
nr:winged helix-turn-helix domain-containing protein [Duganella vulcania]